MGKVSVFLFFFVFLRGSYFQNVGGKLMFLKLRTELCKINISKLITVFIDVLIVNLHV